MEQKTILQSPIALRLVQTELITYAYSSGFRAFAILQIVWFLSVSPFITCQIHMSALKKVI
jgi:hypothetical protein